MVLFRQCKHYAIDDWRFVTKLIQRAWHCLVNNRHVATTNKFFELDQTKVWFNTCRVTIHHQTDGAGWRQH